MEDAGDTGSHPGFLPPRPAGPEPDLQARPAEPAPDAPAPLHGGFAPPAEHQAQPPPQPAYGPPHGVQPGAQQPWSQPPPGAVPDNGAAVAGLTLSLTGGGLLLLSVGTSSIISVVCAVLGIHYSRKGRDRVDRGETPKHRSVAQAGFVTGIVSLALAILATLFWASVLILYLSDPDFRQDLENELDGDGDDPPGGFETSIRLGMAGVRLLAVLTG